MIAGNDEKRNYVKKRRGHKA